MDQEELVQEIAEEQLLREAQKRRFLYSDVEELLEHGFLRHSVRIDGHTLIMRSLLPDDSYKIQARSAYSERLGLLRWSVATSIWMVDGFEIPPSQTNGSYFVYQSWIQDLQDSVVEILSSMVVGLQNRVSRAMRLLESYCYEPYSRTLWRMLGRPRELSNTNILQRMWIAFNLNEDESSHNDIQWAQTRTIVASMSNKAGKVLSKDLKRIQEREDNRRKRIIEETVNWVIYGDEQRKKLFVKINGKEVEVPRIHYAETVADLEDEMRKVFAGEKDFHDHLVEQYHAGIRNRVAEQKREAEEARQRAASLMEESDQPLVGYTRDQLERMRPGISEGQRTSQIEDSARSGYMYDRYFNSEIRPGVLDANMLVRTNDRTPEPGEPTPNGLQEKIKDRKPSLKQP